MAANRILFISYSPSTFIRDEQLLMRAGFDVHSVFGTDGLMACGSAVGYDSVLIDDGCPPEDRNKIISWLNATSPRVGILPADWVQDYAIYDNTAAASGKYAPVAEGVKEDFAKPLQEGRSRVPSPMEVFKYPEFAPQRSFPLEFRLLYRGDLPLVGLSDDARKQLIHSIRKEFHKQLRRLWQQHHGFFSYSVQPFFKLQANNFARCGYRFLPLVCREAALGCSLEVLFLKRDDATGLIGTAGGMDYRLSLLLDALRMPRTCDEVKGSPDAEEDPFFVLTQDVSLINEATISTDRLLTSEEGPQEALLIIHVKSFPTQLR